MKQPQGFSDKAGRVCKLLRNLYGLKQSSRCWKRKFTDFLRKHDLKETSADPCIFVSTNKEKILILGIYIDDGLIAARSMTVANNFLKDSSKSLKLLTKMQIFSLDFK